MLIAVPKEVYPGETRVALAPSGVEQLRKAGLQVLVESGAGEAALHLDADYLAAGAGVEFDRSALLARADALLTVRGPGSADFSASDLDALRSGTGVLGFLDPLDHVDQMAALAERGLTLFSMELVPRITRAQSMDALSSMASIAGYQSVLLAAQAAPRMFPMMMTAAGTLAPTKVIVLGAGVAGLQAIATARRLGAVVGGYDIRAAVKEQIESLGAKFLELEVDVETAEGSGGYAAAQSKEYYQRQQELLGEHLATQDVIITTAAVPGRKAPILITEVMVDGLRPGTVVVDLAAERGGNCASTSPGETVRRGGVSILGPLNLAATKPAHASQMYSKNIQTLLLHLVADGRLALDRDDEITAGSLVAHGGKLVHPRMIETAAQSA